MSTSTFRRVRSAVVAALPVAVAAGLVLLPGTHASAAPEPAAREFVGVGQTLAPGQVLTGTVYGLALTMQTDGNLVLRYTPAARVLWASNTHVPGSRLVNQTDGNAVVRDPAGNARWATGPRGPQDLFVTGCGSFAGSACATGNRLDQLFGTYRSPDGRTVAALQTDGNLVLRTTAGGHGSRVLWASNTHGTLTGTAQSDGNLVLRDPAGRAVWSTGTAGRACAGCSTLPQVHDDGNLVLTSDGPGAAPVTIWSTRTSVG